MAKLGRSREPSGSSRACSGSAVLLALARNSNKGESAGSPGALAFPLVSFDPQLWLQRISAGSRHIAY